MSTISRLAFVMDSYRYDSKLPPSEMVNLLTQHEHDILKIIVEKFKNKLEEEKTHDKT